VRAAGAVVQHRIDQQLEDQRHFPAISLGKGEHGRMAATRALAHQRDPCSIDAERFGIAIQPAQRGVILLDRGRVPRLGREYIFDGDDRAIERNRHRLQAGHLLLGRSQDEAAAMGVQYGRTPGARFGVDHIDGHLRPAGLHRHCPLLDRDIGRRRRGEARASGPHGGQRCRGEFGQAAHGEHPPRRRAKLGRDMRERIGRRPGLRAGSTGQCRRHDGGERGDAAEPCECAPADVHDPLSSPGRAAF
jgi:hypothetical protein